MNCTFPECNELATNHLSWIENRRCAKEEHLCEQHGNAAVASWAECSSEFLGTRNVVQGARQFELGFIGLSDIHDDQWIYLHEVDGSRLVPIATGIFEAQRLDRKLKGYPSPRPLTHDTLAASIRLLGGEVQDVVITRLENYTYYTNVRIRKQGTLLLLDLRPSDAFVLAVLCECPIFVADEVLVQVDQQRNIK